MSNVPIKVFNIAKTQVDRTEVRKWLDFMGADEFEIPEHITDPALLIALAAKNCYKSFQPALNPNISRVRKDYADYFDNILKSGHGSVLEHSVYTFAIQNCSRVFTAEMNRHRAGWAISEQSLRFIRFDKDIPWWMPQSLVVQQKDNIELIKKKQLSQEIFHDCFNHQAACYRELLLLWDMDEKDKNFSYKKKVTSCLRRIIGMGVATGGVWTGNIRALRHVITMRTSPHAEEEICYIFGLIAKHIKDMEPMLFGDFEEENGFWKPKYPKV